jgi:uncharacterized protein YqgV (UPF0045/DUF77 family)
MNKKVNIAVQVLPEGNKKETYFIVDRVIEFIKSSGIAYKVCPFETVLEGEYDTIMKLIKDIPGICYENGTQNVLINLKIQMSKDNDVTIADKMKNYEK